MRSAIFIQRNESVDESQELYFKFIFILLLGNVKNKKELQYLENSHVGGEIGPSDPQKKQELYPFSRK